MILSRFICKLFGHKKRLTSRDGDRAICPRCAGKTFTFKAFNRYASSEELARLLGDYPYQLLCYARFKLFRAAQQAAEGDNSD